MQNAAMKIPGPDHPIAITPTKGRVVVIWNGEIVADSRNALTLAEGNYPPAQYIPLKDVKAVVLERSTHQTYCPYKGDAGYYTLKSGGARTENAIWTYEQPYPAVAAIAGHVAFYPNKVDSIAIEP
jgi:uncharacterized protein (DUF427 family)